MSRFLQKKNNKISKLEILEIIQFKNINSFVIEYEIQHFLGSFINIKSKTLKKVLGEISDFNRLMGCVVCTNHLDKLGGGRRGGCSNFYNV